MKTMKSLFSVGVAAILLTSCNSESKKQEAALKSKQATIDSMQTVIAKQAIVDSMNNVMAEREQELEAQREENNKQVVANNNTAQARSTAPSKKKWNHTAKGAVVGAGTGAVTGAIVNKNRAEGALIGSLIGAGVGAGTGAVVDGQKKKKARNN